MSLPAAFKAVRMRALVLSSCYTFNRLVRAFSSTKRKNITIAQPTLLVSCKRLATQVVVNSHS